MTQTPPEGPSEILLLEDNPGDVILVREALKKHAPTLLTTVCDGEECLKLLHNRKRTPATNPPNLILLDLHLPRMNGHAILTELRKDPALRYIPVVIFSSSDSERDVVRSYELGANCYVPKPFDLPGFNAVLESIVHFWLKTARLPRRGISAEQPSISRT